MKGCEKMDNPYLAVASSFCDSTAKSLIRLSEQLQQEVSEIRISLDAPIRITRHGTSYYLQKDGTLTKSPSENMVITSKAQMEQSLLTLCGYSVHTHSGELRQGFITIAGGHRVGISGAAIYDEYGKIKNFKHITSYVARVARNFRGIGDEVASLIIERPKGLLIASEPSGGKTTILCDVARTLSEHYSVTVVDERMDMGQSLKGVSLSLLSGVIKAVCLILSIRALAPELFFCDDIGVLYDISSLCWAMNCFVPIITPIHSSLFFSFYSVYRILCSHH